MAVTSFKLPLAPQPQQLTVTLNGTVYNLTTKWNYYEGCWCVDIADNDNNPIIGSVPLVTGLNLLEQYDYLAIGGEGSALIVYSTINSPDDVPTFQNLGITGFVAFFLPGTF